MSARPKAPSWHPALPIMPHDGVEHSAPPVGSSITQHPVNDDGRVTGGIYFVNIKQSPSDADGHILDVAHVREPYPRGALDGALWSCLKTHVIAPSLVPDTAAMLRADQPTPL